MTNSDGDMYYEINVNGCITEGKEKTCSGKTAQYLR